MRRTLSWLLAAAFLLAFPSEGWCQAGRFMPRSPPVRPGGGGFHLFGGFPIWLWLCLGGVVFVAVRVVLQTVWSWFKLSRPGAGSGANDNLTQSDFIIPAAHARAKAERTQQLMSYLAHKGQSDLDPRRLRAEVEKAFLEVQRCWQVRDYAPLNGLLAPALLRQHTDQLAAMQREGLINRLDGLRVMRLEFVHLNWAEGEGGGEVTALITFEASSYLADERTDTLRRGTKAVRQFQEFWVFGRQAEAWCLQAIGRSTESWRLTQPNHVAGLSAERFEDLQHNLAL